MKLNNLLSILIAFIVLFSIRFALPEIDGLSNEAKSTLAIAAFSIIIWLTAALEDVISGFMVLLLLCLLHATTIQGALIGYSNSALWLIVIGFIMATSMDKSGLSKRIALILLNYSDGKVIRICWSVAAVMLILTFLVPSITARVLLMLPIVMGIASAFNCKPGKSNAIKAILLIVSISGTMMSMAVITAHAANPITAGLIEKNLDITISWTLWFKVAGLPSLALSIISIMLITMIWRPESLNSQNAKTYIEHEIQALGKLTRKELYTLIVFVLTLVLWATDSLHNTPILVVGLASSIALLWPTIGAITWKQAQSHIPWSVFILYGAGLSMGMALVNTGAAKWIAAMAFSPLADLTIEWQLVAIIWFITVLQLIFTGGGPKTTALMPIVITFAMHNYTNSLIFSMIIGINMLHQYILPVNNMPNMIILGSGYIKPREMIITGIIMSIVSAIFMSIMVFTYWQWLL
ncbi:DASS family sodium-coupled anion symporter [Frischella sp. Ac48]|uniref:SLC13 family permease n=1 Tax=Frischella sp. Ac48 TaxID=2804531 RepID=UPI001C7D9162|nr:DASS family sodium-coupled anion symporter [Frischella sp. Ac48]MBX4132108.1 DASS family sodium-coupled anion symporter [Frischella sp. Ac48]